MVSLNSREKHVAREKVALSRERLHLHNERKQIESRQQCSLCRSSQMPYMEPNYALPDSFMNVPMSREYRGNNVTSAMNAIEEEMAHLLGKNLNLRHCVGMGDLSSHEQRYSNEEAQQRQLPSEPMQVESGPFKVNITTIDSFKLFFKGWEVYKRTASTLGGVEQNADFSRLVVSCPCDHTRALSLPLCAGVPRFFSDTTSAVISRFYRRFNSLLLFIRALGSDIDRVTLS